MIRVSALDTNSVVGSECLVSAAVSSSDILLTLSSLIVLSTALTSSTGN